MPVAPDGRYRLGRMLYDNIGAMQVVPAAVYQERQTTSLVCHNRCLALGGRKRIDLNGLEHCGYMQVMVRFLRA
jgi:hypothetical protein